MSQAQAREGTMRIESSGKPDAWKLARPVWGWGRGENPRPTPLAFNSLYGQWDAQKREPKPDRESWRVFVDRILKLDRGGSVPRPIGEADTLSAC